MNLYMVNNKILPFSLILIILIIFNSACQNEYKSKKQEFNFDKSDNVEIIKKWIYGFSIEPTPDIHIDRASDVVAFNSSEDKMAWINQDKNQVFVTDTTGAHLFHFGSRGQGPEEFLEISGIGFNENDEIIVFDAKQNMFKNFGDDGILKSVNSGFIEDGISLMSRRLHYHNDMLISAVIDMQYASPNSFWHSDTAAIFDEEYNFVKSFGTYDSTLIESSYLYTFPIVTVDKEQNALFISHRKIPFIQVYELDSGERIGRFGMRSPSFKMPDDEADISDPLHLRRQKNLNQSFVEENFISEDYFFFHFANANEDLLNYGDIFMRDSYLNIFEKNEPYNFLGEVALQSIPLYISDNNRVFVLSDDNPDNFQIEVYEINVSDE